MRRLPPKGILDYDEALRHLRIARAAPAPDLADLVECHWEVAWDLPDGLVHRQRNLSHASITVAWEADGTWIYGAPTKVFAREASGSGRAFGTKLRPGALHAFFPSAVATTLTGARFPLHDFLSPAATGPAAIDGARDFADRAACSDKFCRSLRRNLEVPKAVSLVAAIETDRSLLRVESLAERARLSVRDLQRLFRCEVGLSPKETIRRFRLQQAADRFHEDPDTSCLDLALTLGYFDQAHFARDFRAVVGTSPDNYRKRVREARRGASPEARR